MPRHRKFRSLDDANRARQKVWTGQRKVGLLFRAVELGGEAGEALNVVKKLQRMKWRVKGSKATLDDLAEECADTVICSYLLADEAGIKDLTRRIALKFNKTSIKYGLPVFMEVPLSRGEKAARTKRREAAVRRKLKRGPCL